MPFIVKRNRIIEHIFFWMLYWAFVSFSIGLYDFDFTTVSLYSLSDLPITIATTYIFLYRILPFYFKNKLGPFVLFSAILLIAALLLKRIYLQYIQFPLFYAHSDWTFTFFDWYRIVGHSMQLVATIGIVSAFKLYRDWMRTENKLNIIRTEKREMELSYLKAQTNPHFLFNTLNSIYYDVLVNRSNSAQSIIQLSELLRFMLYECKADFIPLEKEIQLINNYAQLQKSRYKNRLTFLLKTEGDLKTGIPPLLCFSLIENAFKHGISESIGECTIDVDFKVDADNFYLQITNPLSVSEEVNPLNNPKGLGLVNVHRQLSLIYEDNYSLSNSIKDKLYVCTLKIPLQ